MNNELEVNSDEVIQNLVNKIALKEYQISQFEVLTKNLQEKIKELQKEEGK
jgi:hypothetical protein